MFKLSLLLLFCAATLNSASQDSALPARISPVVLSEEVMGACPADEMINARKEDLKAEIATVLQDTVIPLLDNNTNQATPNCPCGGPGQWTKIANLDFSDPSVACPSDFTLITTPVRGCGRSLADNTDCLSITFPSTGLSYSRVCGRVNAYQRGTTDAFQFNRGFPLPSTLEDNYIDGVSLTHGAAGSRQHIWTFAAARKEGGISFVNCACTNTGIDWPLQVPSFIGNNYFCDTGNPGPDSPLDAFYSDDPLWDGEGCGPTNACCEFNNPPWFCTTLPQPTTDDIELRVCHDGPQSDEDTVLSLVDISIM